MIEFFSLIKNKYIELAEYLINNAGTNLVIKCIIVAVIIIALFLFTHYFWTIVSFIPINALLAGIIYTITGSKVLTVLFLLTFIPWCFYMKDYERSMGLTGPYQKEYHQVLNHTATLWPIRICRWVRCFSIAIVYWFIYKLFLVYILANSPLQSEAGVLILYISLTIVFLATSILQTAKLFSSNYWLFDTLLEWKQVERIQNNKKELSKDDIFELYDARHKKIGILTGVARMLIYLLSLFSIIMNAFSKSDNTSVTLTYAFIPIVFILCCIWCCSAVSYIENLNKE